MAMDKTRQSEKESTEMTEKKKARRPMTAIRMWKVSEGAVNRLGIDPTIATVGEYIEILRDEALEEMASK